MLKSSRKLLFAIEAVLDIAYNAADTPVQSREITERQGIPRRYLEPVLQQLVRADILIGVRGPRGGYRLGRERRRITLGDICRTVDSGVDAEEDRQATEGPALGRRARRCVAWCGHGIYVIAAASSGAAAPNVLICGVLPHEWMAEAVRTQLPSRR